MSHIDEALRRASRAPAPPPPPDLVGEFVISEDATGPSASRVDPVPRSRALVPRESPWVADTVLLARRTTADDVSVMDVLHTLNRRKRLILAIVLAAEALAVAYIYRATPIYEARARLLVEPSYPRVVPFRPVVEEDRNSIEFYQTQVEVLRSRELARKTLNNLGRLSDDASRQPRQLGGFVGSLVISPVTRSHLIDVGVRSPDPEFAANAANGLAQAYIEHDLEMSIRANQEASAWLTERLADLREQVEASANAVQRFSEGTEDAISLEDRQNMVIQKLTQLNTSVTAARTERIGKQILNEQLRSIEASGAPLDTFTPILSNPFIQSLKAELGNLQRERAQLSERLGGDHPEMMRVEAAIDTTEKRLAAEIQKIVDGIRNDHTVAEANERQLVAALEDQKGEVQALNRDSIGWGALQRDAASAQQIYESVLQRFKEADLAGELRTSHARILDRAELPDRPVTPRTLLILVVAFLGGSFVAVGLVVGIHYLRRRIDTPADIADTLALPLLGITPKVAGPAGGPGRFDAEAFPPALREAIRGIRARILLDTGEGVRTMAITSASAGEGKTLVSSNLAISIALAGRRVLLIDGDMRQARVHEIFDIPRSPGLAEIVAGTVAVSAAVRGSGIEGLSLVPAGAYSEGALDLLDSGTVRRLIDELGYTFDVVVFDCPPVLAGADASIIATATSGTVFVVAGASSADVAQVAVQRLLSVHASVVGAVLNNVDLNKGEYPYYARET